MITMRSLGVLGLTLLLVITESGIKAESSSLSFMNLIPNLIANGRFVQENLIDSSIDFNQTLPWINVDLTFDVNGSNCSRDMRLLAKDLATRQTWALKTLDAWGKLPSGIMQGNIYWIGSVYECEHHLRGLNNSVVEQPFLTRTCVVGNGFSDTIRPVYGICVPQSCNADDMVTYINTRIIRIPFIKRFIHLTNDSIQCIDPRPYDTKAILTIVILSLIFVVILLVTGMHLAHGHQHSLQTNDETVPTGYEPILSQTITTTADRETSIITTTARSLPTNPVDEQDEASPLIARPGRAIDSVAQNLIHCCSFINNYHVFKHESPLQGIACLNGIRVLSLWWVILGHTVLFAAFYSDNVITVFNWSHQFWFQIIMQAVFSIDSFFLLSGLLTAFLFFMSKTENERFSIVKFLMNHYIYRYLRYTIFYAIMLLIYITLSPYFGQGGPVYPMDGTETSSCRRTWWRNLLYINNFFESRDSCMPVTWFLATNMQFHWIAPLFLLAASWKWLLGMLVATAFIIVDIVTTAVIISKNNYDHGIFDDYHTNRSNSSSAGHNYMNDVYVKPWCRIAPYAVGLLLGYTLHQIHQRANTLTWESILPAHRNSARYKYVKQIIAWLFALVILALCIFGTYGDYNDHPLTRSGRIAFHTLSRLGWSIGLSIIIVACFAGHGGPANKLLSHSIFQSLAKLTFGAYLWHSLVLVVNYLARDQPVHYTITNILFDCTIHIIISYLLSFFTFLLIELPIIQLLKLTFPRRTINYN